MTSEPPQSHDGQRRGADRTRYTCLAWIENDESDTIRGIARLLDISTRGIGLLLATSVPTGTRVVIELMIPGPLRLRGSGQVVHTTSLGNGQTRVGVQLDSAPVLIDTKDEGDDSWRT